MASHFELTLAATIKEAKACFIGGWFVFASVHQA
jgi:hypothetical protein